MAVTVEAIRPFEDLVEHVDRVVGERWEVDRKRAEAINSTQYGQLVAIVSETRPFGKLKGRPTKAELLAQAEELGIEVPEGSTNPEIAELIEEAL